MNLIMLISSLLLISVSATTTNTLQDALTTVDVSCPKGKFVSQANANVGAVMDRANFRCNDLSSLGDFGAPNSNVLSPKIETIRLPNTNIGWDTLNVGYSYYAPLGQEVVTSYQLCQSGKCFEAFFYGLTVCSADSVKEWRCPRIVSFKKL